MKASGRTSLGLFIAGVVIGLVQLWFSPWSEALFTRLVITVAALLLVSLVVLYYQREGRQHDNIHRGGDIDD